VSVARGEPKPTASTPAARGEPTPTARTRDAKRKAHGRRRR
jgi:hypothetical protein